MSNSSTSNQPEPDTATFIHQNDAALRLGFSRWDVFRAGKHREDAIRIEHRCRSLAKRGFFIRSLWEEVYAEILRGDWL